MPRVSNGRQKIEMKKITNQNNLLVCFSKRHTGLFKKASELCTLCGVELAIVVFSPTQKVFSFGNPSVQTILDRFLNQNPPASSSTSQLVQRYRNANIQQLNTQLSDLLAQLEVEKRIGEELDKTRKAREDKFWWDAPIENLGVEELQHLKVEMLKLKKDCEIQKLNIIMTEVPNAATVLPNSGSSCFGDVGPAM